MGRKHFRALTPELSFIRWLQGVPGAGSYRDGEYLACGPYKAHEIIGVGLAKATADGTWNSINLWQADF